MEIMEKEDTQTDEVSYLDSSCSNHMTDNKNWFLEKYVRYVKIGTIEKIQAPGHENIVRNNGQSQQLLILVLKPMSFFVVHLSCVHP